MKTSVSNRLVGRGVEGGQERKTTSTTTWTAPESQGEHSLSFIKLLAHKNILSLEKRKLNQKIVNEEFFSQRIEKNETMVLCENIRGNNSGMDIPRALWKARWPLYLPTRISFLPNMRTAHMNIYIIVER